MFKKIRQVLSDHKAMTYLRRYPGNVLLVWFVGNGVSGFDCYPYQRMETKISDSDPAKAIIRAIEMYNPTLNGTVKKPAAR